MEMDHQNKNRNIRIGIKAKFIGIISFLCLSIGLVLGVSILGRTQTFLEDQYQSRGMTLARTVAGDSHFGLAIEDGESLQKIAGRAAEDPDVAYVAILDMKGRALAHSIDNEIGSVLKDNIMQRAIQDGGEIAIRTSFGNSEGIEVVYPVIRKVGFGVSGADGETLGFVRIGISLSGIQDKIRALIGLTFFWVSMIVLIGIAVSWALVGYVTLPLDRMVAGARRIAQGDFTGQFDVQSQDEIGLLGQAFLQMSVNLKQMIQRVQEMASHVNRTAEQMRLSTQKVVEGSEKQGAAAEESSGSVQEMSTAVKSITESTDALSQSAEVTASSVSEMSVAVKQVAGSTVSLATSVEDTSTSLLEMSASIRSVLENVTQLSNSFEETAASVNEMNASIREVEQNAKQSAILSEKVNQDARESGMGSVEKTIEGMERIRHMVERSADVIMKLSQRTEQIGKILTVIDDVTRQTNLLALNAAILAAQAGEDGKGFTVVADEIKNLADRTAASTKEISHLIHNVQGEAKDAVTSIRDGLNSVNEGVRLTVDAKEALQKILDSSHKSSQMCRSIEGATVEQVKAIRQVMDSTQAVNMMIQQIARAMQEQNRGTDQITQASENIRNITRQVKLATEEQAKGTQQISGSVEDISVRIQQIALALQEQKRGGEKVTASVLEIKQRMKGSIEMAAEVNRFVEDLVAQTERLKGEVARFKVA